MPAPTPKSSSLMGWPEFQSLALACLAGLVFVGIVVLIATKLRSWMRKDSDSAVGRDEMLIQFRELQRQGGLTEDEYRSIRGSLVAQSAASSSSGTESVQSPGMESRNREPDLSSD